MDLAATRQQHTQLQAINNSISGGTMTASQNFQESGSGHAAINNYTNATGANLQQQMAYGSTFRDGNGSDQLQQHLFTRNGGITEG